MDKQANSFMPVPVDLERNIMRPPRLPLMLYQSRCHAEHDAVVADLRSAGHDTAKFGNPLPAATRP